MALLPIGVGISFAPAWAHVPLFFAYFSAFHVFHAGSLLLKARRHVSRRRRFIPPVMTWSVVSAVFGVPLLAYEPSLLWWGCIFFPLIVVALWAAWRGHERSLSARISTILASSFMLPVAVWLVAVKDAPPLSLSAFWLSLSFPGPEFVALRIWGACAVLATYFVGTVPYVRSLIRGRGDARWVWGSGLFHACAIVCAFSAWVAGISSFFLVAVSMLLLCRALGVIWLQRVGYRIRPAAIGIGEFACTGLVLIGALVSF